MKKLPQIDKKLTHSAFKTYWLNYTCTQRLMSVLETLGIIDMDELMELLALHDSKSAKWL